MNPLLAIIDLFVNLYFIILVARIILPLFGVSPYNSLMRVLYQLTEPVLAPIRAILPQTGMFDFSPMVAMILLTVVQSLLSALFS